MKTDTASIIHWRNKPPHNCLPIAQKLMQTTGLLTLALSANCGNPLSVSILYEGMDDCLGDEANHLNLPRSSKGWVRSVLLNCRHKPVLYARSFIPLTDAEQADFLHQQHEFSDIRHIGTQPLGIWLSQQITVRRSAFEYALTDSHQWPHWQHQSKLQLPSRRSCFSTASSRLLLSEVFLQFG
jgi:chorismate-pyruvate lyase